MSSSPLYLSLGSNLGDREGNLRRAVAGVQSLVTVRAVSPIFQTEPYGVTQQPAFLNIALAAVSDLAPEALLSRLQEVEKAVGRRPTFRWGPRVVDIDILLYDRQQLETPELTIPHREMRARAFVLLPLAAIAPDAIDPVTGRSIAQLARDVPDAATVHFFRPWEDAAGQEDTSAT